MTTVRTHVACTRAAGPPQECLACEKARTADAARGTLRDERGVQRVRRPRPQPGAPETAALRDPLAQLATTEAHKHSNRGLRPGMCTEVGDLCTSPLAHVTQHTRRSPYPRRHAGPGLSSLIHSVTQAGQGAYASAFFCLCNCARRPVPQVRLTRAFFSLYAERRAGLGSARPFRARRYRGS